MRVFTPIEVLTGVSLMLGVFMRLLRHIGALQILNLWLGLYSAPGEWPWTYFFLLVVADLCGSPLWPQPWPRRNHDEARG